MLHKWKHCCIYWAAEFTTINVKFSSECSYVISICTDLTYSVNVPCRSCKTLNNFLMHISSSIHGYWAGTTVAEIVSLCVGILAVIVIATVTAIIVCFCLRYITVARCLCYIQLINNHSVRPKSVSMVIWNKGIFVMNLLPGTPMTDWWSTSPSMFELLKLLLHAAYQYTV